MATVHGEQRIGDARVLVQDAVSEYVREAITAAGSLYAFAARREDAETIMGRGTIYVIPGPGQGRWVIRHLSHGGLLAPLTGDLFPAFGVERPFNEFRIAQRLREMGVATPEVVAAAVYPSGPMYRGEVARVEIADARDLADSLFGAPTLDRRTRLDILAAAGRLLRSMHRAGLIHPDLNLRNILIELGGGRPVAHIIDLEKCRLVPHAPQRWVRRMMRRLRRSVRKFEALTGRSIGDPEWHAFQRAYAGGEDGEG